MWRLQLCNVTPLRKMSVGGLLAAASFIMAGLLQLEVNKTMEPPPATGRVYVQRIGNISRAYPLLRVGDSTPIIGDLPVGRTEVDAGMYNIGEGSELHRLNLTVPGKGYVIGLRESDNSSLRITTFMYAIEKTDNGGSRLYFIVPQGNAGRVFVVNYKNQIVASQHLKSGNFVDIRPAFFDNGEYTLYYGMGCEGTSCPSKIKFTALMGSVTVLHLDGNSNEGNYHVLVRPNTVSILWVVPQFIVITLGEVLLSVTGLEFAYSQSAPSMKSFLQVSQ
ncbi:unnamed protein product [Angiostrongylus costaricensis]|uniref:DUF2846 domain-containing protein n=1 Tax=Angiostrongylus costaricensis TaxID=334426 RepID=A0A0R3PID7_ANGCS|nr:unnamed protein product [Angiostrongylus costaricensis]